MEDDGELIKVGRPERVFCGGGDRRTDMNEVSATVHNGVLTLCIKKLGAQGEQQRRKITVGGAGSGQKQLLPQQQQQDTTMGGEERAA